LPALGPARGPKPEMYCGPTTPKLVGGLNDDQGPDF
jgi:hypothetical protein